MPDCEHCGDPLGEEYVWIEGIDVHSATIRAIPAGIYHLTCLQGLLVSLKADDV